LKIASQNEMNKNVYLVIRNQRLLFLKIKPMKTYKTLLNFLLLIAVILFTTYETAAQIEFELKPSQSMSITGKGPGQDAAKNPFEGEDCLVFVENIGKVTFAAITQQKGQKYLKSTSVAPGKTERIQLPKNYELYLDTTSEGTALARLSFKKQED
jgi:hypothetical protein